MGEPLVIVVPQNFRDDLERGREANRMDKKWDWKKAIPIDEYYTLSRQQWPGWELSDHGEPHRVMLQITKDKDRSSRNVAIEWDDLAEGTFYYRDYTANGSPFLSPHQTYHSLFIFQKHSDAIKFNKLYGGIPG